jgi:hypothetical protein
MKNIRLIRQTVRLLLAAALPALFLTTGCKTGELKDQVMVLSQKEIQLVREKDSLMQLVMLKSQALDSKSADLNAVTAEKSTLETKNKTLQSGLYTKGEQLKKTTQANEELNKNVAQKEVKNDSLRKEIITLEQRIALIDAAMAEAQKSNSALALNLKEQEEKRIADSTALANKPKPVPPPKESGFISITEVGGGFGMGDVSSDYSRTLVSITTLAGYRINNHFITGIGAGGHFYNGGTLIPLYLDMRYTFRDSKFSPFIVADGGILFNISDFSTSGLFINPGIGLLRKLNNKTSLNISVGGLIKESPTGFRATFVNFRGGVSFRGK